jgi:hypothetical protein
MADYYDVTAVGVNLVRLNEPTIQVNTEAQQ